MCLRADGLQWAWCTGGIVKCMLYWVVVVCLVFKYNNSFNLGSALGTRGCKEEAKPERGSFDTFNFFVWCLISVFFIELYFMSFVLYRPTSQVSERLAARAKLGGIALGKFIYGEIQVLSLLVLLNLVTARRGARDSAAGCISTHGKFSGKFAARATAQVIRFN